jgi:hypothetical protein
LNPFALGVRDQGDRQGAHMGSPQTMKQGASMAV